MGVHNEATRVATLYRVSLTRMVEKDDIPMQKTACREFIDRKNGWTLVNEYTEKGISGYKVSSEDRDVLQEVIRDAVNGEFDVLLVFSTDRLGRIADEYTPIVKRLSKTIEVWSVSQGDLTIRNHTDALKTYVDGWQNEGESIKISMRTDEKHKQMVQQGLYRGGVAPFGYSLVLSGRFNERDKKQRKELYMLQINESEAEIVRTIFRLVIDKGWGGNTIAQYLNKEAKIHTREGFEWSMSTINYMLRNPIYKGYPAYGKNSGKSGTIVRQSEDKWVQSIEQVEEWVIVSSLDWERVQRIRKSRKPHEEHGKTTNVPTRGKLLLVGFIHCGSCGKPLTTAYHNRKWTTKDGIKTKKTIKYECSGKKRGNVCEGQRIYVREKIEGPVIEQVLNYLKSIKKHDFSNELETKKKENAKKLKKQVDTLMSGKLAIETAKLALEEEVAKSIIGDSPFKPDMLAKLINKKDDELKAVNIEINKINDEINTEIIEATEISEIRSALPEWEEIFNAADDEKKKMLLSTIIDDVLVYPDSIKVMIKLHIEQFLQASIGVHPRINGESA